jgi:hypothetical protein
MIEPLNSPIEVGVRVLIILDAVYPSQLDINRLVLYDYTLLHSSDLGGPESIHPAVPGRTGEMGLKRTLIEQGLQILRRAGLADISATSSGILYAASQDAAGFIAAMSTTYAQKLIERASWVNEQLNDSDDAAIRTQIGTIFSAWSEEFDAAPGSLDAE